MPHIKSLFISAYMSALAGALIWSALTLWNAPHSLGHGGVLLASGAPMAFFARLFLAPVARTSPRLTWIPLLGLIGSGIALATDGLGIPLAVALFNGVLLSLAYIHWYSRFEAREGSALAVGGSCLT